LKSDWSETRYTLAWLFPEGEKLSLIQKRHSQLFRAAVLAVYRELVSIPEELSWSWKEGFTMKSVSLPSQDWPLVKFPSAKLSFTWAWPEKAKSRRAERRA
jgi:hypothetical protein